VMSMVALGTYVMMEINKHGNLPDDFPNCCKLHSACFENALNCTIDLGADAWNKLMHRIETVVHTAMPDIKIVSEEEFLL
jgi:hypothetical protein